MLKQIATLLISAALTSAARLTISIPPSPPLLPNPATLPSSTHAVLLGPPGVRYDVPLRRDNSFIFPSLDSASYLLSIHSRDHFFPPLRIDVSSEGSSEPSISAWQTFRGNEWSNKGPHYGTGQDELSIEVRPIGEKQFYQERQGFSLVSFLRSPMILMGLVSVLFIFGLPYLMDNSMFSGHFSGGWKVLIVSSGSRNESRDGGNAKERSHYWIWWCSGLKYV